MLNPISFGGDADEGVRAQAIPSAALDFRSLLSPANRRRLLQGSRRALFPAGAVAVRPDSPPAAFLIESGLARMYWDVPDGRQATISILRPTELAGGATAAGQPSWLFMQVITESLVTVLDVDNLRHLTATELDVSAAINEHLVMRVRDAYRLIAVRSLGNIRERMAYDLLDRASKSQLDTGRLEVTATQADLADSIGSSREVMSRALKELRFSGIIETAPGAIRVLDPARLEAIVRDFVI